MTSLKKYCLSCNKQLTSDNKTGYCKEHRICPKKYCNTCGKELISDNKSGYCRKHWVHEKKYCITCRKELTFNNKTGYCKDHFPRTGINNPFYGKHHSKETIQDLKQKCSDASKENWQDHEYREKVIKGVSKPRRPEFKVEQSERIRRWYVDNPEQFVIRSEAMKRTWADGRIGSTSNSCRSSKMELEFFEKVQLFYPYLKKTTIHNGLRWFFPDILVDGRIVIEFFGDFWHANPEIYSANDIIKGRLASDIWEHDNKRIKALEVLGYQVFVVWEKEYYDDPESVLAELDMYLNWESCAF